jgi:replicative DNA helicase
LSTKVKNLEKAPLFIDDAITLILILAGKAFSLAARNPNYYCGLFAINDRWRNGKEGREQEISTISRNLKALQRN